MDGTSQLALFEWQHRAEGPGSKTFDEIQDWCKKWFKYWVFQKEMGDSGYVHWQGAGSLFKKRRRQELKTLMRKDDEGFLTQHCEPITTEVANTIKNVHALLEFYVAKYDTRVEGPWTSAKNTFMPRQYAGKDFVPWQQKLIEIAQEEIKTADIRTIHWVYDWTGNHGKSVLSALIELRGMGIDMPANNDFKELCAALADICMDQDNRDPGILMLDLPRAMSKNQMNGFTTACEQWKKGSVVDQRHHFRKWWFHTPSVWIFSNTKPPLKHFSRGRWKVWAFTKEGLDADLVEYKEGDELKYGVVDELDEDSTTFNPMHRL